MYPLGLLSGGMGYNLLSQLAGCVCQILLVLAGTVGCAVPGSMGWAIANNGKPQWEAASRK
jgi:hypothetical protein